MFCLTNSHPVIVIVVVVVIVVLINLQNFAFTLVLCLFFVCFVFQFIMRFFYPENKGFPHFSSLVIFR